MRFKKILPLIIACTFSLTIMASAANGGDKKNPSDFSFTIPSGWITNNVVAEESNLNSVYYPDNTNWGEAKTVIFSNVLPLETGETIEDIVNFDIENYSMATAKLEVNRGEGISLTYAGTAEVVYLMGTAAGSCEAIAYIPQNDHIITVVMSAKNKREFTKNIQIFEELVASFRPVAQDVAAK